MTEVLPEAAHNYSTVTACGYWLNASTDNPILMSGYITNNGTPGEALGMRFLPMIDPITRNQSFESIHFKHIRNPITDLIISGTPKGPLGAYGGLTPTVNECVLYFCVETKNTSYYWGELQESSTDTYQLDTMASSPWEVGVSADGYEFQRYLANFSLSLPPRAAPELHDNRFEVSNLTAFQVILMFDEIAPSFMTSPTNSSESFLRWFNLGNPSNGGQPPTIQLMSASSNPWLPPNSIADHMSDIAKGISYVMRNSGDASNQLQLVQGISWSQMTQVHIRWRWITLPLTFLGSTAVFLVATVIRSSLDNEQIGIWKTSAIAILFNGLGEDVQHSLGPHSGMREARAKAESLRVMLVPE